MPQTQTFFFLAAFLKPVTYFTLGFGGLLFLNGEFFPLRLPPVYLTQTKQKRATTNGEQSGGAKFYRQNGAA